MRERVNGRFLKQGTTIQSVIWNFKESPQSLDMILGSQGILGIVKLINKEFKNVLEQIIEDNFINIWKEDLGSRKAVNW